MDAMDIAEAILKDCQFRDNGAWYDLIDERCGGGSQDGGFDLTAAGRRFSVTVHEYESEDE